MSNHLKPVQPAPILSPQQRRALAALEQMFGYYTPDRNRN